MINSTMSNCLIDTFIKVQVIDDKIDQREGDFCSSTKFKWILDIDLRYDTNSHPAAPRLSRTSPFLSVIIVGVIDDNGRFPGLMKFAGDAAKPYALVCPGVEKSSISSFNIIPVLIERLIAPKLEKHGVYIGLY